MVYEKALGYRVLQAFFAVLILLFLSQNVIAKAGADELDSALTPYFSGAPLESLAVIDATLKSDSIGGDERFSYLYWSILIRTTQMLFDDAIWDHIRELQDFSQDDDMLRWTIAQAVLAGNATFQGDWQEAHELAEKCLIQNRTPAGDALNFVYFCLRIYVESSALVGAEQMSDAIATANAYVEQVLKVNRLYKSDICNLLAIAARAHVLRKNFRRAFYAAAIYDKHAGQCVGSVTGKFADYVESTLTILLELGAIQIVENFLEVAKPLRLIDDEGIGAGLRFKLKWALLNAYALIGDPENAERAISAEEAKLISENAKGIDYPYHILRQALLAFAHLRNQNYEKFQESIQEVTRDSGLVAGFIPAIKVMQAEQALLTNNIEEAADTLLAFGEAFLSDIARTKKISQEPGIQLNGYNRLIASQALSIFSRLSERLRKGALSETMFRLAQMLSAHGEEFGLSKVYLDNLVSANAVEREFRSFVRANERSADVELWRQLNRMNALLESDQALVVGKVDREVARAALRSAQNFRAQASFEKSVYQTFRRDLSIVEHLMPLSVHDARELLYPQESLFSFIAIDGRILSFCVSQDRFTHEVIPLDVASIGEKLKLIDNSLRAISAGAESDGEFPYRDAYDIYHALFSNLRECVTNAEHLLFVPPPDLLLLPYNALVENVAGADQSALKWFLEDKPYSLVTSLSSLRHLRRQGANRDVASKSFLALANPQFNLENLETSQVIEIAQSSLKLRSGIGISEHQALEQLPNAEEEAEEIASLFPQDQVTVISGSAATEVAMRKAELDRYRFVSFATHALVAGEFEDLSEPSIALVPGNQDVSRADGLVTASEVSQMKLVAELVLLSACNTAAGDGGFGAPGFSGLADAFLSAGAKAVFATQWAVDSIAAKLVATSLMKEVVNSNVGSAIANRIAIKQLREDESGRYQHPKYWAGFLIVGDGYKAINKGGVKEAIDFVKPPAPFSTQRFEKISNKPRWAEWLDAVSLKHAREGFIAVGYSGEAPDGTASRAAGIVERYNQHGRSAWRLADSHTSFTKALYIDEEEVVVGGYEFTKENATEVVLTKISLEDGDVISKLRLPNSKGLDSIEDHFTEGTIVTLVSRSERLVEDEWERDLSLWRLDVKSGDLRQLASFGLDQFFAETGIEVRDVSGIHLFPFHPSGSGFLISVSVEIFDKDIDQATVEFGRRNFCFYRYAAYWVGFDGKSLKLNSSHPDLQVLNHFPVSNSIAYLVRKPCAEKLGVWIGSYPDYKARVSGRADERDAATSNVKEELIKWPTELRIGDIVPFQGGFLVAGSLKVPRPFKKRTPHNSDYDQQDLLSEESGEEYDPQAAFLLKLSKDYRTTDTHLFQDQRSRFISKILAANDNDHITILGTARGGDSWISQGTLKAKF